MGMLMPGRVGWRASGENRDHKEQWVSRAYLSALVQHCLGGALDE